MRNAECGKRFPRVMCCAAEHNPCSPFVFFVLFVVTPLLIPHSAFVCSAFELEPMCFSKDRSTAVRPCRLVGRVGTE
jgi:hypothetical protein